MAELLFLLKKTIVLQKGIFYFFYLISTLLNTVENLK